MSFDEIPAKKLCPDLCKSLSTENYWGHFEIVSNWISKQRKVHEMALQILRRQCDEGVPINGEVKETSECSVENVLKKVSESRVPENESRIFYAKRDSKETRSGYHLRRVTRTGGVFKRARLNCCIRKRFRARTSSRTEHSDHVKDLMDTESSVWGINPDYFERKAHEKHGDGEKWLGNHAITTEKEYGVGNTHPNQQAAGDQHSIQDSNGGYREQFQGIIFVIYF